MELDYSSRKTSVADIQFSVAQKNSQRQHVTDEYDWVPTKFIEKSNGPDVVQESTPQLASSCSKPLIPIKVMKDLSYFSCILLSKLFSHPDLWTLKPFHFGPLLCVSVTSSWRGLSPLYKSTITAGFILYSAFMRVIPIIINSLHLIDVNFLQS